MTYQIRDRQDGMFEIVIMTPVLAGIFPERETALRFCAYLSDIEPELIEEEPSSFGQASRDVREAEAADLLDQAGSPDAPKRAGKAMAIPNLPTVRRSPYVPASKEPDERPRMAAQISDNGYWPMTDAETQAAFARIQQGEKISDVARDCPVSMGQLRGKWANYKRNLQKHMAAAGPQPCKLCAREFTPSISNPDTCARCSK